MVLAIEAQWYLVWPVVVLAALSATVLRGRRSSGRRHLDLLGVGCLALAAMSAGWMYVLSTGPSDVSRAYYGTDTRAQALLVGAAVAFVCWGRLRTESGVLARGSSRSVAVVGAAGLVAVTTAFVVVVDLDAWMYRGGFLAVAICWAAVVVAATNSIPGPVRRLFSFAPVVALGRISYGVYLWHWPIQLVMSPDRIGWSGGTLVVARLVLTLIVATLSFLLVEQPLRRAHWSAHKDVTGRVLLAGSVASALVVVAVVSVTFSGRGNISDGALASETAVSTRVEELPRDDESDGERRDADPPASTRNDQGADRPVVVTLDEPDRPVVVTLGDSVAFDIGYRDGGGTPFDVDTRALLGCGLIPEELWVGNRRIPRPDECATWMDGWVAAGTADVVLIFLGTWEAFDPHVDGNRMAVGSTEWNTYLTAQLQAGIDVVTTGGAQIGLMTVPCYVTNGMLGEIASSEREDDERIAAVNAVLRQVAEDNANSVTLMDWATYACPQGAPLILEDGSPLRPDGVHPDDKSTPFAWDWITRQVEPLLTG